MAALSSAPPLLPPRLPSQLWPPPLEVAGASVPPRLSEFLTRGEGDDVRQVLPDSPLVIGLEKRGGVVDVSFESAAVVAFATAGAALEEFSRRGDMPEPTQGKLLAWS